MSEEQSLEGEKDLVLAFDPEIAKAAAEIQRQWSARERRKRAVERGHAVTLFEFNRRDLGPVRPSFRSKA